MMPMILAVDPDIRFAEDIAACLPDTEIRHMSSLAVAETVLRTVDEAVIIVGPGTDFDEAVDTLDDLRAAGKVVGAVVVARRPTTRMMRRAMQADVADVLPIGHEPEDMFEAVQHALPRAKSHNSERTGRGAGSGGRVLTVFSAKGGCGKSTLAANMGVLMTQRGQSVCILDLDLQFGDAAIMFQLEPSLTIQDAVLSFDDLDIEAVKDFVTVHSSGVSVLAAPANPSQADDITTEHVEELLDLLRQAYDWVIVDTPAMFTDPVIAALDVADRVVVVSSFDVPSIKNLRIGLQTLKQLDVDPHHTDVVMMRADAKVGLRLKEVERTIGASIDVAIPSDREVTVSLNHGVPLAVERPKSGVVMAINELVDRVLGAQAASATGGATARAGLLRRRSAAEAPSPS